MTREGPRRGSWLRRERHRRAWCHHSRPGTLSECRETTIDCADDAVVMTDSESRNQMMNKLLYVYEMKKARETRGHEPPEKLFLSVSWSYPAPAEDVLRPGTAPGSQLE